MTFPRVATKNMEQLVVPSTFWLGLDNEYLKVMLPELAAIKQVEQRNGVTVFDHTMRVLDALEARNPVVLWAAVFHDVGKASFPERDYFCKTAFPRHEIISLELAGRRLDRWRAEGGFTLDVLRLVKTHMIDIKNMKHAQVYRNFIASIGLRNIDNWFHLRRADSLAYSIIPGVLDMIDDFRERLSGYLNQVERITVQELAVTPEEIASHTGLTDDEQVGRVVDRLLDSVNSGTCANWSAQLLHAAHLYAGMERVGRGLILG